MNLKDAITRPALLLDAGKCRRNIAAMTAKAARLGVRFRPHFKTHQSRAVGRWFREGGTTAITVSSVAMASYFADDGWNDITVAFPVNVREIDAINALARRIRLHLLVESPETVAALASRLVSPCGAWLKIDSGYGRTGIDPSDSPTIDAVLAGLRTSQYLKCEGFLTHAGQTYHARSREEIASIHAASLGVMRSLRARYAPHLPGVKISIGDTPACSAAADFAGVDEMRPGNFVFYDIMQEQIGSCSPADIAVAVALPVVAKHPERNEIVLYGGAVHLSKDFITDANGRKIFGSVVDLQEGGWSAPVKGAALTALSQEHGIVAASPAFLDRVRIGDLVGILPAHSCLTADCMRGYLLTDGTAADHL